MFAMNFNGMKKLILLINGALFFIAYMALNSSCAVIVPPSGGPKDTLPPVLVTALPKEAALNVNTKKITLTFDEFVTAKEYQQNLIVSPNPKSLPLIEYKYKNVTIKLKDSLEPNTTYTINFGNTIKDVNEGNIAKNFTYIFSTGNYIDTASFHGKVMLAETGKNDSTLIVVLYKNLNDTAVIKNTPRYYAKTDSKGNFYFKNLPNGMFKAYVIPDDFNKKYDDSTKMFAFLDSAVNITSSTKEVTFYAFEEEKRKEKKKNGSMAQPVVNPKNIKIDKQVKVKAQLDNGRQDLLNVFTLEFSKKLKTIETDKIHLYDTLFHPQEPLSFTTDSTFTKISIRHTWKEDFHYKLIIAKDAVADSFGSTLAKADTLSFASKRESDYGSIRFRFPNVDTSKHPVLLLISNEKIFESYTITQNQLFIKLFQPGDYELRVLFDRNRNKKWDTGNFKNKVQPEIVKDLKKKITIKADYDNEFDVNF